MLRKLFKYELKATGRVFIPLFMSLLVFAVITKLFSTFTTQWPFPAIISGVIYNMIMAGMFVMPLIVMIQRFCKNLLSDEGYLMFTLPTKPWKLIVSKLLASMLWVAASIITAVVSVMIITYKRGMIYGVIRGFSELFSRIKDHWSVSVSIVSLEMIIAVLIGLATGILLIYASIAVGHLFSKHKILASFGAFIILSIFSQILFVLIIQTFRAVPPVNIHISSNNLSGNLPVIQMVIAFEIIFAGLLSAAYFSVTNFILSKRLNLE